MRISQNDKNQLVIDMEGDVLLFDSGKKDDNIIKNRLEKQEIKIINYVFTRSTPKLKIVVEEESDKSITDMNVIPTEENIKQNITY